MWVDGSMGVGRGVLWVWVWVWVWVGGKGKGDFFEDGIQETVGSARRFLDEIRRDRARFDEVGC